MAPFFDEFGYNPADSSKQYPENPLKQRYNESVESLGRICAMKNSTPEQITKALEGEGLASLDFVSFKGKGFVQLRLRCLKWKLVERDL